MNASNAKDYLPLVKALAEGRAIQVNNGPLGSIWEELNEVAFDFPADQYRIKPEPREIWVNRYMDGSESDAYSSKEEAVDDSDDGAIQVRYREVI